MGPRTVMARMKVAPPQSLPQAGPKTSFDSHFSAPLETEGGSTLVRLMKQRSAEPDNHGSQCSQSWKNGEIGEKQNVASVTKCQVGCSKLDGCAGWTYNTNNKWCGYKGSNQIKPVSNVGFVSGAMDASNSVCYY